MTPVKKCVLFVVGGRQLQIGALRACQDRHKAQEARHKAVADYLRANMGFCINGRDLKPGTREFERELKIFMETMSPEEMAPLLGKMPHA